MVLSYVCFYYNKFVFQLTFAELNAVLAIMVSEREQVVETVKGLRVMGIDGDFTLNHKERTLIHDYTKGPADFNE